MFLTEERLFGKASIIRFLLVTILLLVPVFLVPGCEKEGVRPSDDVETATSGTSAAHEELQYIDGVVLDVEKWGPRKTKRGQGFNVQAGDRYAFWIGTAHKQSGDKFVVTLDGKPLRTMAPPPPAQMITASISADEAAEIINFKGIYPLAIIDLDTRVRQQIGEFVVE